MKKDNPILLFIALIAEGVILLFILLFFLFGFLGFFLPAMPGLFFVGIGVAIYYWLLKSRYGKITSRFHPRLVLIRDRLTNLSIIKKTMGLFKSFKKKKEDRIKEDILKNGLILFAFNVILMLAFILGLIAVSFTIELLALDLMLASIIPLLVIFVFAGTSAIVWFRFGQILANNFGDKKIINASLTVLISVLPLLLILMIFSSLIGAVDGFKNDLSSIIFLGIIIMTVISAAFQLLVVNLGAITAKK